VGHPVVGDQVGHEVVEDQVSFDVGYMVVGSKVVVGAKVGQVSVEADVASDVEETEGGCVSGVPPTIEKVDAVMTTKKRMNFGIFSFVLALVQCESVGLARIL
jgi:hypothetical protein